MATEIGALSTTGLLTCKLCDWSEWQNTASASGRGQLTLHWADAHSTEYARIQPKAAATIQEEQ